MFRKVVSLIICTLIINVQISLGCDNPVTHLKKGEPAPCTGYLFSPEKEQEVRITVQEYAIQKEELELKTKKINLLLDSNKYLEEISKKEAEKAELWRSRAIESTEKLVSVESNRGKRDWMFLIGGVILTIGSGYALGQAANK